MTVPTMYADPTEEPTITIGIPKLGGGTLGVAYANGGWEYAVYADGVPVIEGNDLRSGAMGATHDEMARTLADFLSNAEESLYHAEMRLGESEYTDQYDDDARAFLVAEYERLSQFAEGML